MKNIKSGLFDHSTLHEPVSQGSLLVAQPFLREDHFLHAVIAMISYPGESGPVGVVLNMPTDLCLHDALPDFDARTEIPVFSGGPVGEDRMLYVHTLGPDIIPGCVEFVKGMYYGGDFESMVDYVNAGYPVDGVVRFIQGYSGWEPGQLENELDNDVWAVSNALNSESIDVSRAELLALWGDRMWHSVVRTLGTHYKTWRLHPAQLLAN